jgi:hypothetical protein
MLMAKSTEPSNLAYLLDAPTLISAARGCSGTTA